MPPPICPLRLLARLDPRSLSLGPTTLFTARHAMDHAPTFGLSPRACHPGRPGSNGPAAAVQKKEVLSPLCTPGHLSSLVSVSNKYMHSRPICVYYPYPFPHLASFIPFLTWRGFDAKFYPTGESFCGHFPEHLSPASPVKLLLSHRVFPCCILYPQLARSGVREHRIASPGFGFMDILQLQSHPASRVVYRSY